MNPQIVSFIFARGGSKGLPRKNLLLLAGKPLIVHAIDAGLALTRVNKVVVSTDNLEIADTARQAGAVVPFLRPAELATDTAPEWLAWKHAIHSMREAGDKVDIFLSLPPTSPLRTTNDIDCCLDALLHTSADIVITVRDAERSPYFNMVRETADGLVHLAMDGEFYRRQDAPILYDMTTVAYAAKADFILEADRIFDGKVKAVWIPRERAIDIDTKLDFVIAETLMGNKVSSSVRARII